MCAAQACGLRRALHAPTDARPSTDRPRVPVGRVLTRTGPPPAAPVALSRSPGPCDRGRPRSRVGEPRLRTPAEGCARCSRPRGLPKTPPPADGSGNPTCPSARPAPSCSRRPRVSRRTLGAATRTDPSSTWGHLPGGITATPILSGPSCASRRPLELTEILPATPRGIGPQQLAVFLISGWPGPSLRSWPPAPRSGGTPPVGPSVDRGSAGTVALRGPRAGRFVVRPNGALGRRGTVADDADHTRGSLTSCPGRPFTSGRRR